uniref:Putative secreted protein n=1 Tax=Anopheles marajoara TaxID=58244 RepID=A0A2M4C764_9DIPT
MELRFLFFLFCTPIHVVEIKRNHNNTREFDLLFRRAGGSVSRWTQLPLSVRFYFHAELLHLNGSGGTILCSCPFSYSVSFVRSTRIIAILYHRLSNLIESLVINLHSQNNLPVCQREREG